MTAADWYELVARSGLVDGEQFGSWRNRRHEQGVDAAAIAERMVADGLLTQWQSRKLLAGKWRGFTIDHYRLTDFESVDEAKQVSRFRATDMRTGGEVILEVVPRSRGLRADGMPIYSVRACR